MLGFLVTLIIQTGTVSLLRLAEHGNIRAKRILVHRRFERVGDRYAGLDAKNNLLLKIETLVPWKEHWLAFQIPVETRWRKPLQLLCRQWLSVDAIRKHGVLKESFVEERLGYLEKGEFLAGKQLTSMIALHAWMEKNEAAL